MQAPRLLRVVRWPELEGSTVGRVRTYIVVNLVAIWTSVLVLGVLTRVWGPSRTLTGDIVALVLAGLAYGAAHLLVARSRLRAAVVVAVLATWLVAFSLAWTTPFTTPVSLLILHVPSLVLTDVFGVRTRTVLLGSTVVLTGVLVAVGEARRTAWQDTHPPVPGAPLLVGFFTLLVAAVLVLGIRDAVLRLARHGREVQESRARLAAASLEARRSIERDLHDGAQQRLAALAVDIGRLTRALEAGEPSRATALAHGLQGQLEAAMREVRDLAHGIYPPALVDRGLGGALPAAARRTTLPCAVDVQGLGRHEPAVEAAVYFCCLEAMQNADRHSGGTLVTVLVRDTDDAGAETDLRFVVVDDGTGFDLRARADGHGLTGMRDRIRAAGGEVRVTSVVGVGTTVEGRFPRGTRRPDRASRAPG